MNIPEVYNNVRTTFNDDTLYFSIVDVVKIITDKKDLKSATSYWSSFCKDKTKYKKLDFKSTTNSKKTVKTYGATIEEMSKLIIDILQTYRNHSVPEKQRILEMFNVQKYIRSSDEIFLLKDVDETKFLDKLITFLKPFNITGVKQYPVLNYRIDFYIESLNVAIEYDENEHKNYNHENESLREKKIKEILDESCQFIRISNKHSDDYNLGYVSKEIYRIITEKLLNDEKIFFV